MARLNRRPAGGLNSGMEDGNVREIIWFSFCWRMLAPSSDLRAMDLSDGGSTSWRRGMGQLQRLLAEDMPSVGGGRR